VGDGCLKTIGLISDTHIPTRAKQIPHKIFEVFKGVELIIHAGDLTTLAAVEQLSKIAEVIAVHGNMDNEEVRRKFPNLTYVEVFGWKIGVIHNAGDLFGKRRMRKLAQKYDFDVLVHGHTHNAKILWEKDVLYINPGSPTFPLPPFFIKPTVAILRLAREEIHPKIVELKKG
jgi:hypothetical protein